MTPPLAENEVISPSDVPMTNRYGVMGSVIGLVVAILITYPASPFLNSTILAVVLGLIMIPIGNRIAIYTLYFMALPDINSGRVRVVRAADRNLTDEELSQLRW